MASIDPDLTKFASCEALLDALPDAAFLKDASYRYRVVNRAFAALFGLAPSDFVGRRDRDLFPAERAARFEAQDAHVLRTGTMVRLEDLVTGPDGLPRHMETVKVPYHDAAGAVAGVAAIARDVTERREAEQRLADTEARHQLMVRGSERVFFYAHDVDGRLEYVSPSVYAVLGYEPFQLIGRRYHELLVAEGNDIVIEATSAALTTGEPQDVYSGSVRHRDGRRIELELSERPIIVAGRVIGMEGFARDITARVRAQRQLESLNARLLAVVQTSPLPIIVVDDMNVVHLWNRAAERTFGFTADEVIGCPYPLTGPSHAPDPEEMLARAFRGEVQEGIEIERYTKDGRLLQLQLWSAALRNDEGLTAGALGVMADVTGQRSLEEQLRQAQKMEAVGRLAGGIAHDFNNVLTAIHGYADIALDQLHAADPIRSEIQEIRIGAERARALTRQLLTFSRRQVLTPVVLDLRAAVKQLRGMLLRLLGEDVVLEVNTAPDLWPVRADASHIDQVLINLAINARDAMPKGGRLSITLRNVTLSEPAGDFVEISVHDTGCGIPAELLPLIFEPFFTTKEAGVGTGLGLATVYGIVEQSGGTLHVDSTPGAGTCFRVCLPRAHSGSPQPDRETRAVGGGSETILLVEDEVAVRSLTRRVLVRAGYRVIECADGAAALKAVRGHLQDIDLLLTDMVMPGMSGWQLAESLRAERPDLRVLFMSGYSEEMLSRQGTVAAVLEKPFSPRELAGRVRGAIDGERG